ncbi:MAG: undecaprenyl-diphosphate phosphatase, partial [Enterococcus sp.]
LKIVKFLMNGNTFGLSETIVLLVGMITAFVVSIVAIKFLLDYIKRNDFTVFGWYRIILGIILIAYWLIAM